MAKYSYLLLAFLIWVRPVFPVVEYLVNYTTIVTELCENKDKPQLQCNGKCHLAKQLAKSAETDSKKDSPKQDSKKTEAPVWMFTEPLTLPLFLENKYPDKPTDTATNLYQFIRILRMLKPPEEA